MHPDASTLTTSTLIALASEQLGANGYRVVRDLSHTSLPGDRALLAEDDYSIVAIVAFDTWAQLEGEWADAQAELVALIGRRLARSAPKAWDGYLVLFCTGGAPDKERVAEIERDTTRIRKIVATADTLQTTSEVGRVLDIFMPLALPESDMPLDNVLESLPQLMRGAVDPAAVTAVVEAFKTMEPPLEKLHALGRSE